MQNFKLLQAEIAVLVALVDREIDDAILSQRKAKSEYVMHFDVHLNIDGKNEAFTRVPNVCDGADLEYWTERLRMLRALKAKLERDGADAPPPWEEGEPT